MFQALFIVTMLAATTGIPTHMEVHLPTSGHPCVFLSEAEGVALRERAAMDVWQANATKILSQADAILKQELDIPRKGGQWSHWYTCKKDGGRLSAKTPTEHVCKVCGEVYSGFPYDEVYFTYRHNHWLNAIETLGIAYALDPEPAYAERAREILLTYASFYEELPLHDYKNGTTSKGARMFAQTLNEAVGLCHLAVGYDLVHDAPCFTEADHADIGEKLLRPMVAVIQRHRAGKSNWQSWHNAAIAAAGMLLRDAAMVDQAVNDPKHGFLFQMQASVLPSGMWYEGAPSYHWYALSAHVYLLEATARAGMDLYALPIVKAMFSAPPAQLFPDKTFPAINDSSRSSIDGARNYYEVAYRRYGDPNFLALATPHDTRWGLLWGNDAPEGTTVPPLKLTSHIDDAGGLAILRNTAGDTALFFNYSPQKGGHTHPAKLDIILFAHDDVRIVDPGRLPYGNPLHRAWYCQTLAHNTVVVNETTQANASGRLQESIIGEDYTLVRAVLDQAYENVRLDRTVYLKDNVMVDVFRGTSAQTATFDLPLHFKGTFQGIPEGKALETFPNQPRQGYDQIRDIQRLQAPLTSFSIDTGQGRRIAVTTNASAECYTASGRTQPSTQYIPMLLRRQHGLSADFITVYQILEEQESPHAVEITSGEQIEVQVGRAAVIVGETTTSAVHK